MSISVEAIHLPGVRCDAESKLAQMLISGLISSFDLTLEKEREGSFNVVVLYKPGRGKKLFGLATNLASEALEIALPSSFHVAEFISQLIHDLKQGSLETLAKAFYESTTNSLKWTDLPDPLREAYVEQLKFVLLENLNDVLHDLRSSLQSLSDFEYMWESCWHRLFEHLPGFTAAKLGMNLYVQLIATILNLGRFLETNQGTGNEIGNEKDHRYYDVVNIAASIALLERLWIQQNPTINNRKRAFDASSTTDQPDPKRLVPNNHPVSSNPHEGRGSMAPSIFIDHGDGMNQKPVGLDLPNEADINKCKEDSSTINFIARTAYTLLTGSSSAELEHPLEYEKLINAQIELVEKAVSGYDTIDDRTKDSIVIPFTPVSLKLSIPPFLWNATATSNYIVIMKLKQIYYKLIDHRYQTHGKEQVKYVDDVLIRTKEQYRNILDASRKKPTNPSTSSSLSIKKKVTANNKKNGTEKVVDGKSSGSMKPITMTMELGEWASLIISSASSGRPIRPTARLDSFFYPINIQMGQSSKDIMIFTLNRSLNRLIQFFKGYKNDHDLIDSNGLISPTFSKNHDLTADIFVRGIVYLFYYILEAILVFEASRMKLPLPKLLECTKFYQGMFTFSCICLYRATGGPLSLYSKSYAENEEMSFCDNLDTRSILELFQCSTCDYFRVSEAVVRSLVCFDRPLRKDTTKKPVDTSLKTARQSVEISNSGLPTILLTFLRQEENFLLESHLWVSHSNNIESQESLWSIVEKLGSLRLRILDDGSKNESFDKICNSLELFPDYSFMAYIFRRVLIIASKRIADILARLSIPPEYPIASRIWETFLYILRNKLDLLRDRHLDQIILCTVYALCKVLKYNPPLTFVNIVKEYFIMRKSDIGENGCDNVVRDVRLNFDRNGDILEFYNTVFIPVMKEYLLKNDSQTKAKSTGKGHALDSTKGDILNFSFTIKKDKMNLRSPGSMVHCHSFGTVAHFHKSKMK